MRNRGAVFNGFHIQACCLKCRDCTLPATARALHSDLNVTHSHFDGLFRHLLRSTLTGKRGAFPAPFEAASSGARPAQCVPFGIRNRHGGIVERCVDVRYAHRYVTFYFSFFDLGHEAVISGSNG